MGTWHIYLNELSLSVMNSSDDLKSSLLNSINCCNIIKGIDGNNYKLLFNPDMYNQNLNFGGINLSNWLLKNRDISQKLKLLFSKSIKKEPFCLDGAEYKYKTTIVTKSCMAEAYESKQIRKDTYLINLSDSYESPFIEISKSKDGKEAKEEVLSFCNPEILTFFLQKAHLLPKFYKETEKYRPQDAETILVDRTLFTPTKYGNRGNRLYKRKEEPSELWCLDRGHRGSSVHLEVFSETTRKQIHVSRHDKIDFFRELTAKEKNRRLVMKEMP